MVPTENTWWTPWREMDGAVVLHVDLAPDAGREAWADSVLDVSEKGRSRRFRSVRARREFVLCRAALRINLAERLGCSRGRLSFGLLEHGKPYVRLAGRPVDIAFNVSHSGRHGLIAITSEACVGVDVEERASRRDLDGIGSLVYGPEERRLLGTASGRKKVQIFYRLWSMKEALIKALGTGFSLSPSGFEVPRAMLHGERSGTFRFPHLPSQSWRILDLGEPRFAAALAYRLSS
ncbi:MAG: 4'-phosphopantetheinyl transferase superfamily protein [bacterium]|nr:4'-phosphopantetheinyl transferase superfamily protein [bacterium]MDE0239383.1 4'-phosphopantetheinyl transferase superfamily protein [bacterium]MDE0415788.1 4'-phosphopantetheinyl transferase superfamily protein [bacterium]